MAAKLQRKDSVTWLDGVAEKYYCPDGVCEEFPSREALPGYVAYHAALYWSLTTITSVKTKT